MSPRKCAFIQARACPIDVDEIPLDVCKLCIDAWKTSAEIQTITGANILEPTITMPSGPQALQMVHTTPTRQPKDESAPEPFTFIPSIDKHGESDETEALLYKLDNDFMMDRITADEYVEQRRKIVDQLAEQRDTEKPSLLARATAEGMLKPEDSMPAGPPEDYFEVIDLNKNKGLLKRYKQIPLLLIERTAGKLRVRKYPEDWTLPKNLDKANLESIYDLYDELRQNQEKILLQYNGTKIGILGKRNNRILCMILEDDDKIEDYQGQISRLTDLLETKNDFDDLLKALPEAMGKKNR